MTLDLTQLAPKARERYIRIGRRYGSDDTFKQANQTLEALQTHAGELIDHGCGPEDESRLSDARDAISVTGVGRETKTTEKKTTRKDYIASLHNAKTARYKGRTILENTLVPLNDEGKEGTVHKVEATLGQTSSLPAEGQDEALAAQLDLLASMLADATVANAAKTRGGPKALTHLQEAAPALRAAAKERAGTGTQLSTEEMDLIDGIIVTLCRAARKAAKQAAKELGRPALLADFALSHITPHHAANTDTPEPEPSP